MKIWKFSKTFCHIKFIQHFNSTPDVLFRLSCTSLVYLKHSVHFQMKLLLFAIPKFPDTVVFALFSHTPFFQFRKTIDRTLFERGNVLILSSYRPDNKKNHETYDGRGVQQTLNLRAFWKSAPGLINIHLWFFWNWNEFDPLPTTFFSFCHSYNIIVGYFYS